MGGVNAGARWAREIKERKQRFLGVAGVIRRPTAMRYCLFEKKLHSMFSTSICLTCSEQGTTRDTLTVHLTGTKLGLGLKIVGGQKGDEPRGIFIKELLSGKLASLNGKFFFV